jgi:predicted pyridoxine 5'-phosphate oxidase superfamily flavin-nucleotide-binding protein
MNNHITLSADVKSVIEQSPYLSLTTVSKQGEPHTIAVGKAKDIRDSEIVFGVYKMEKTRKNLAETGIMQVVGVNGKIGYRLEGKAKAAETDVLFHPDTICALL